MRWQGLTLALFMVLGCVPLGPDGLAWSPGYDAWVRQWRKERYEALRKEDGWLALAGLYWLSEGEQSVGSGAGNDIVLAHAPDSLGKLLLAEGTVRFLVNPGVEARVGEVAVVEHAMVHDGAGTVPPDKLRVGPLTLIIIERGGRLALRVFDADSLLRADFRGLPYFPTDPGWRLRGTFVEADEPRKVAVSTVIRTTEEATVPGEIHFKVAGEIHTLTPITIPGTRDLFIVFGDATNGPQTYGGGRFLTVDEPGLDGSVILDFNRATNPPCAFTDFATCPVPWPENRLSVAVEAGEKLP